jgi:tetratricopeptide (TPR) repeat protein
MVLRVIVPGLVVIALAACGHTPAPRPAVVESAIEWNQRGQSAFRAGELARARDAYRQALRLYRSIEDADGIATELINVAWLEHALGDTPAAKAALDEVSASRAPGFPATQRAEAAYRRAWIAQREQRPVETAEWLARAEALCRADCPAHGRILNLHAQSEIAAGRLAAGRELARRALAANQKAGDKAEEANALRLLAETLLALGDAPEAALRYEQALALDKETGQPDKVAADLLGLGAAARARQRLPEAREYYRRALAAAEAGGSEELRRAAAAGLERLPSGE